MDGKLYFCIDFLHVEPGKGNTFMRTKLKDVVNGYVLERRFNIGDVYKRQDEWFISANSILYVKDGCTLEYDLPNGISTIARQIGFMGKDFLDVYKRQG